MQILLIVVLFKPLILLGMVNGKSKTLLESLAKEIETPRQRCKKSEMVRPVKFNKNSARHVFFEEPFTSPPYWLKHELLLLV